MSNIDSMTSTSIYTLAPTYTETIFVIKISNRTIVLILTFSKVLIINWHFPNTIALVNRIICPI